MGATCTYFEINILTRDEAALGIGAAFKRIEENRGTNAVYEMAEMVNKKFPICKYAYPERLRYGKTWLSK